MSDYFGCATPRGCGPSFLWIQCQCVSLKGMPDAQLPVTSSSNRHVDAASLTRHSSIGWLSWHTWYWRWYTTPEHSHTLLMHPRARELLINILCPSVRVWKCRVTSAVHPTSGVLVGPHVTVANVADGVRVDVAIGSFRSAENAPLHGSAPSDSGVS